MNTYNNLSMQDCQDYPIYQQWDLKQTKTSALFLLAHSDSSSIVNHLPKELIYEILELKTFSYKNDQMEMVDLSNKILESQWNAAHMTDSEIRNMLKL